MTNTKKLKVMWLEDSDTTALNINSIEHECECKVDRAKSVLGASQLIQESNGGEEYMYIVVDLNIDYKPRYFSTEENEHIEHIYIETGKETRLAGLIWLLKMLKEYPKISKKVIVFSAYLDKIPDIEKKELGDDLIYINKFSADRVDQLLDAIKR